MQSLLLRRWFSGAEYRVQLMSFCDLRTVRNVALSCGLNSYELFAYGNVSSRKRVVCKTEPTQWSRFVLFVTIVTSRTFEGQFSSSRSREEMFCENFLAELVYGSGKGV